MLWTDFKQLIRRHAPDPATVLFIKHDGTPKDILTIFDTRRLKRIGALYTGRTYDDFMRDSMVCNAAWLNGEIPLKGWQGTDMVKDRPARGAISVIKILLQDGVLRPSRELDEFIGASSKDSCPQDMRLYYAS